MITLLTTTLILSFIGFQLSLIASIISTKKSDTILKIALTNAKHLKHTKTIAGWSFNKSTHQS